MTCQFHEACVIIDDGDIFGDDCALNAYTEAEMQHTMDVFSPNPVTTLGLPSV